MKRILFVCTGNTCRSPMAEGLFRLIAEQRGFQGEARSAGVFAADGMPVSGQAAEILSERGAEAKAVSQGLTKELADWADLILTMTVSHKRRVIESFPEAVDKTFALKEYAASFDVEDDSALKEREQLVSALQIKQALKQPISDEERSKLAEIEQRIPDLDITDPIGGDLGVYRRCAAEIEQAIGRTIERLEGEQPPDPPKPS